MYQRNLDVLNLDKAEDSIHLLKDKIDRTLKLNSVEQYIFDIPGKIEVDPNKDQIIFTLKSAASRYDFRNYTCLVENCSEYGKIGEDFIILKAKAYRFENRLIVTYTLKFRNLIKDNETYKIDLITSENKTLNGRENSKFIIKNLGEEKKFIAGVGNTTTFFLYFGLLGD